MFLDGTINTNVYIMMLQNNLLPFIDGVIADGATDVVFQQGNATPHVAKRTRAWFENTMQKHRFTLMKWPPNSPDIVGVFTCISILLVILTTSAFSTMLISALLFLLNLVY